MGSIPADILQLAIVANVLTPYRLHFHQRVAREMPGVRLHSLFTHELATVPSLPDVDAAINPVYLGRYVTGKPPGPRNALSDLRAGIRACRYISENHISAVVLNGYNDLGRMYLASHCRRNGVPLLLFADSNIRGDVPSGWRGIAKRLWVHYMTRRCSAILPCGQRGIEYFAQYGVPAERMFRCPYEPDYELIEQLSSATIGAAATRFRLAANRCRIAFCGRLVKEKRVDLAIAAFAAIAERRPNWDLVIVGDGPLRDELQSRVPDQLRKRVQWTGGIRDQTVVSAIYRLCDVLLLPSDREPWAVVLQEAACAGLALVASDAVGAAAELIRNGANGFTFGHGRLDELVSALLSVTDPINTDVLKKGSRTVLSQWRTEADPISGLADALKYCGFPSNHTLQ